MLVDPFKISLAVVAALLTIVGFSINDTIVVFDRIREVRGKSPDLTEEMINLSVNATLSRTLLTSGTVFIASVILYFVGGPGIHAFAYSMVIGVIAGTFSSVYIAAPVLLWMKKPGRSGSANGARDRPRRPARSSRWSRHRRGVPNDPQPAHRQGRLRAISASVCSVHSRGLLPADRDFLESLLEAQHGCNRESRPSDE